MKLRRANTPHHGIGEHGRVRRMPSLMDGAHLPERVRTGNSDARGYQQSAARQMGAHKGPLKEGDTRKRQGPEGNSKGSPPPGIGHRKGVRGNPDSHMGDAGRGGAGRQGKADSYKGQPTSYSENISHDAFEKLGAK